MRPLCVRVASVLVEVEPAQAAGAVLLPGGLEPGVRRPGGALQRALAGVSQAGRGAGGHLRRRRLVPSRLLQGPQAALSAAVRLRAPRKGSEERADRLPVVTAT